MIADMPAKIEIVADDSLKGQFLIKEIDTADGVRRYKVYLPESYDKMKLSPLIVVLHGCTQDPDDVARGTRFNSLAEESHFIVAYPEQPQKYNGLKCWNWFDAAHQKREAGEPGLIASITRQVMNDYSVDSKRVYIAGMSAGGAMALTVAYAYPELFAAAGIHSGIPYGAVGSIAEALAVMHGGAPVPSALPAQVVKGMGSRRNFPAIVFQGKADKSVAAINADQIVSQLSESFEAAPLAKISEEGGQSAGGYHYTRRVFGNEKPMVEQWVIDELGHAWSGGSKDGTYTDPNGPDAGKEMVRFFMAHPRG